jgi:hypothetical protein
MLCGVPGAAIGLSTLPAGQAIPRSDKKYIHHGFGIMQDRQPQLTAMNK